MMPFLSTLMESIRGTPVHRENVFAGWLHCWDGEGGVVAHTGGSLPGPAPQEGSKKKTVCVPQCGEPLSQGLLCHCHQP